MSAISDQKMQPIDLPPNADISVIIPVFNEAEGLPRCHAAVVKTLEEEGRTFQIIYVDDGSTDKSAEILDSLAKGDSRITLIALTRNIGQQPAMRAALPYCRGRAVITFDSDLQFHPDCLGRLADEVFKGTDVVGGVRNDRQDSLFLNRIPSAIGRFLINRALGIRQQDFGGVKAYSRALVARLCKVDTPYMIIPAHAYRLARTWLEIPVRHQKREIGKSKWSLFKRMQVYFDVYTEFADRPFGWVVMLGGGLFTTGAALGVGILAYRLLSTREFSGLIIFFAIFLLATGAYTFVLALIGEFVVRIYRSGGLHPARMIDKVVETSGPERSLSEEQ